MMNYKQTIQFLKYHYHLSFRVEKQKESFMYGMGNRCKDGNYLLFLDYDDTPLDWVVDEIRLLHTIFLTGLSNAYLFKTKNGLHVVFLNKHSLGDILSMMKYSSCDKRHMDVPMRYARRVWVLRQQPKKEEQGIEYLGMIPNPYVKEHRAFNEHSKAHKLWLQAHYKIPKKDFTKKYKWDGEKKLIVGYYYIAE